MTLDKPTNSILDDPKNIEILLQERPELRKYFHTCMSTDEIKEILQGQKQLSEELKSGQKVMESFNASLTRIFRLYEKHDSEITNLEKWKERKDMTNSHTEDTIQGLKGKDGDLESKIDIVQSDVNNMKVDIGVIKSAVLKDEKKEERRLDDTSKILVGIVLILIGAIVPMAINFIRDIFY